MAGGDKRIHLHPKAGSNSFKHRPKDAGRKPKIVGQVIKDLISAGYEPVQPHQVADAYKLMIGLDQRELEEKFKDPSCPVLFRVVIKSMLSGKGFEIIEKMIDRAHGKALEQTSQVVTHKIELSEADIAKLKDGFNSKY